MFGLPRDGALLLQSILKLAPEGVERVTDCDVHVLVIMVFPRVSARYQIESRQHRFDADAVNVALAMIVVADLDHDVAARQCTEQVLEALDSRMDLRGDWSRAG